MEKFMGGYEFKKYLGKGKSGTAYLVEKGGKEYVYKQLHDIQSITKTEMKLDVEVTAYERLKKLQVNVPDIIQVDEENRFLVKSYIKGNTLAEEIANGHIHLDAYLSFYLLANRLESQGYNLDYFPTNFIYQDNKIFYIDYEVNPYCEEWNFENWGMHFWFNTKGFKYYLQNKNDELYLVDSNQPGKPIKSYTEKKVQQFINLITRLNVMYLEEMFKIKIDPEIKEIFFKSMNTGMAGRSYCIHTNKKSYFIKLYEKHMKNDEITSEILASSDFCLSCAPKLLYSDITLNKVDFKYLIFEYIPGNLVFDCYNTAGQMEKDIIMKHFTKAIYDVHQNKEKKKTDDFVMEELLIIENCLISLEINQMVEVLNWLKQNSNDLYQVELSRIHGDYHPWNALMDDGQIYIIDWKYRYGDYRYDVAWTFSLLTRSNFNEMAVQFINYYKELNENVEKDFQFFVVLAGLRWYVNVLSSPPSEESKAFFETLFMRLNTNISEITGIQLT